MRVTVGKIYHYSPNGWDSIFPVGAEKLTLGQQVKVINLPGAPKANTMGQCYVADVNTGKFLCMVSTGSLCTAAEYLDILKAMLAKKESAECQTSIS
jgi:hypothetical protein